jgi:hypothetical protein
VRAELPSARCEIYAAQQWARPARSATYFALILKLSEQDFGKN